MILRVGILLTKGLGLSSFGAILESYLILESGDYLLTEAGFKFILE